MQTVIDKIDSQALVYKDYTTTTATGGEFITGEDWDTNYMKIASNVTDVDSTLGKAFEKLG